VIQRFQLVAAGFQPANLLAADTLSARPLRALRRPGLTLLEVIVALAIFLVALVPVWHLVSLGGEHARDVAEQAQASLLCQNKLDCVKSGVEGLNGPGGTVDIGNLTWSYTIESNLSDVQNVYQVKVTAKADRADGKTVEASMTQFILDPSQRGSTIATATTTSSAGGN
jgi:prepilin-type N-terminal cleavage/methylation domain-containing protein